MLGVSCHRSGDASGRAPAYISAALVIAFVTCPVRAQDPVAIGDGPAALPGTLRTRVAAERPRGFALRFGTGYGFTESVEGAPGPHHRFAPTLGVSGQFLPWLGAGIRLYGHADFHPDDGLGVDRGFVGGGALELRATPRVSDALFAGVSVTAIAHGGDAPSLDLSATSLEATALVTVVHDSLTAGLELGYRVDRSAETIPPGVQFRPGDRLALGASAFDAVLVRLAANQRWARVDVFGEVAFDALVGRGAPPLGQSPIQVVVGTRVRPTDAWQVEFAVETTASARGALVAGAPPVPVDPRVGFIASAGYRFGVSVDGGSASTEDADAATEDADGSSADAGASADGIAVDAAVPPAAGVLEGRILDASGAPLVDARIEAEVDGARLETYTDADGRFRLVVAGAPDTALVVTAHGYEPARVEVRHGVVQMPASGLALAEASPRGVVRGDVRDYDGTPVRASVRIMPSGRRIDVGESGAFEIELPPGRHELTIEAEGFTTQERRVVLADGEVTILHIDLRRAR